MQSTRSSSDLSAQLIQFTLDCVQRKYPNCEGSKDAKNLHPIFYGCFDWHSSVHGHWAMVRQLGRNPAAGYLIAIRNILNEHFTAERTAGEIAYLSGPDTYFYECPYGWGWFLLLCAELFNTEDEDAQKWRAALEPLENLIIPRCIEYFSRLSYPIRYGIHSNSGFSLALMIKYAKIVKNNELFEKLKGKARQFYLDDVACPATYEPSGYDFLSPCLAEADLMRLVLEREDFLTWLGKFLPPTIDTSLRTCWMPPSISDLTDPLLGHLIGLTFHRAWTLKGIAMSLDSGDSRRNLFLELSELNSDAGLQRIEHSGYGGTHWLASYAIYLLTEAWR